MLWSRFCSNRVDSALSGGASHARNGRQTSQRPLTRLPRLDRRGTLADRLNFLTIMEWMNLRP